MHLLMCVRGIGKFSSIRSMYAVTSTLGSISTVLSMHTVPAAGPEPMYGTSTVLSIHTVPSAGHAPQRAGRMT